MEDWELIKMDHELLVPLATSEYEPINEFDVAKRFLLVSGTEEGEFCLNSYDDLDIALRDVEGFGEGGWEFVALYDLKQKKKLDVKTIATAEVV